MGVMDYHSHHYRCGHALCTIEDYIKAAVQKGLSEIGISEHFPILAATDNPKIAALPRTIIGMPVAEFGEYIQEIKELREKYHRQIKVKISTEIAFISSGIHFERQKKVLEPFMGDFDYLLCGIHDLRFKDLPTVYFLPEKGSEVLKTYGEKMIQSEYIRKMRSMVETGYFDIVTHLDNQRLLWLPNEPAYGDEIWRDLMSLLDLINKMGMAVEINTSGTLKHCASQFPCDEIVKELIIRNIPLTLCSDAHRPENIGYEFEAFINKAKHWGLTNLCSYEKRKQTLVPIN
jgi:histidinol-phosphatase (PHP family)